RQNSRVALLAIRRFYHGRRELRGPRRGAARGKTLESATHTPSATPSQMPMVIGPGRSTDSSTLARRFSVVKPTPIGNWVGAACQSTPFCERLARTPAGVRPLPGRAVPDAAPQQGGPHGPLVARNRGEASLCFRRGKDATQRK